MNRRSFLNQLAAAAGAASISSQGLAQEASVAGPETNKGRDSLFTISLSQWSYHRAIFGNARVDYRWFIETLHSKPDEVLLGDMDPRDIVIRAREHGVDVVDLVNILWFGNGQDTAWLNEFKRRAAGEDVVFGGMMCDELGQIGSSRKAERNSAVEKHIQWMATAAKLGCTWFRVNPYGDGTYLEQCKQGAESLHRLGEASRAYGLDILVENHGHPGSNGAWLAMLVEMADHPSIGVLADFDNFFMGGWNLEPERRYDRLQGMLDLAPYTRAVSAKSLAFDTSGNETTIDYELCMKTVLDAGFLGMVGAEYEGKELTEKQGTQLTIDLLRKTREALRDD